MAKVETLPGPPGEVPAHRVRAPGIALKLEGLRARVLASMGALLVGQGVTAAIQLLSLPLFLHFWDTARYGKWVMLTAVPAYFSMSDAGMLPVAANRITMLRAASDDAQANAVFQSALALVIVAIGLVGGGSALVLGLIDATVLDTDSRLALWLLITATLLGLFGGLYDAGFRAYGSYAHGVLYANAIRGLEFCGMGMALVIGGSFTAAALGLLGTRALGSLALGLYCRKAFPELRWGLAHASRAELRGLLQPALTFMAFPLGNALSIQAITLVVGALFGTVVVATFNTYRTLSRLVLQMVSTLGNALWTEFSRLYGAGEREHLQRVYHRSLVLGGVISLAASLAMIPMAPLLLQWWTHGKIGFDAPVFLLFALVTLTGGLSTVPRVLLLSTNRHSRLGVFFLGLSALGVAATFLLGKAIGPSGAVLASAGLEAAVLGLTVVLAHTALAQMPLALNMSERGNER
jgi:O-antigen/teichoic acid export membrane protein